ncbi:MAG TPA: hypothetical protein VK958_08540 [Methylophilus sp.]|uniref:hypothetical protein n=1 Tax=Methylophilus sp. TaxID=29541 RepID=UPI002BA648F6|nr:hypothetical protein [Methylophilus sp.]HSH87278.1 hypothetical protein [Methylophilus sp.]
MTKAKKSPSSEDGIDLSNIETLFVDKIVNIGIGFNVSRLTLTQEVADDKEIAFANLIIPTTRLFEFIKFMSEHILENEELKKGLITSIDEFKKELTESEK